MLLAFSFCFILFKRIGTIIISTTCFSRSQSEPLAVVLALVLFWQDQARRVKSCAVEGSPRLTWLLSLLHVQRAWHHDLVVS